MKKAFARLIHKLALWLVSKVDVNRPPDFVVGADSEGGPYLERWWILPRNRFLNVYLHNFLRDDDDRALHDHPWHWCSILLHGSYLEHTIQEGGIHHRQLRHAPSVKFSRATRPHRVELLRWSKPYEIRERKPGGGFHMVTKRQDFPIQCQTLFITGPLMRQWGFLCPQRGWVHWKDFTKPGAKGEVGPGCGDA